MLKKLAMILLAVAAMPALASPVVVDPYGDPSLDPMAECECQRYGFCPAPPPPPPPPK